MIYIISATSDFDLGSLVKKKTHKMKSSSGHPEQNTACFPNKYRTSSSAAFLQESLK